MACLSYANQPIRAQASKPSPSKGSYILNHQCPALITPGPDARHLGQFQSPLKVFTLAIPIPAYLALPCLVFACRYHDKVRTQVFFPLPLLINPGASLRAPQPSGMAWNTPSSVCRKLSFNDHTLLINWPHCIRIIIHQTSILKHMPLYRGEISTHFQLIVVKQESAQYYRHSEFFRKARNLILFTS